MRRPTSTTLLLGGALLAGSILAGCGDTSAEGTAADGCSEGAGETVTVEIPEFAFSPDPIEISACDSVVWENTHDQAHTSTGKGDKAWSTDSIAPGEQSEPIRFEDAGSFSYICALHPFMEGTVEVA